MNAAMIPNRSPAAQPIHPPIEEQASHRMKRMAAVYTSLAGER
jgi:hypothetical protein